MKLGGCDREIFSPRLKKIKKKEKEAQDGKIGRCFSGHDVDRE